MHGGPSLARGTVGADVGRSARGSWAHNTEVCLTVLKNGTRRRQSLPAYPTTHDRPVSVAQPAVTMTAFSSSPVVAALSTRDSEFCCGLISDASMGEGLAHVDG